MMIKKPGLLVRPVTVGTLGSRVVSITYKQIAKKPANAE